MYADVCYEKEQMSFIESFSIPQDFVLFPTSFNLVMRELAKQFSCQVRIGYTYLCKRRYTVDDKRNRRPADTKNDTKNTVLFPISFNLVVRGKRRGKTAFVSSRNRLHLSMQTT